MKYEKVKLKEISSYVTERIETEKVGEENYVSTENMVANKGGKVRASKLPNSKSVIAYKPGDVLISNIRPYFKKIWFSNNIGGTSADVLVIRSNEKVIPDYLYYFLSQDKIFDYMVQTSKGTKMPRGDKQALMDYELEIPNLDIQKNISKFFSNIDKKIEINNSLIFNLEELAQTFFKHWFVDFEFPNDKGSPYKSSGGKMVESELGMIPEGWTVGTLADVGEIVGGGTPSKKVPDYYSVSGISWLTPKDLSTNKSIFQYKGVNDISELGLKKSSARLLPENTVLYSSRAPIGYTAIAGQKLATNQGFKSIIPFENYSSEYVYLLLKHLTAVIEANAGGSTFKEISAKGMKQIKTILPLHFIVKQYGQIVNSVFDGIKKAENENMTLKNLRDTLLPKLLLGTIDLKDVEIK